MQIKNVIPTRLHKQVVGLSTRTIECLPKPEPKPPNGLWRYRVSQPFIAPGAEMKVTEAIRQGKISSATSTVTEFESELRSFFGVPTAVACSNGYSALYLALRAANISVEDEVLIPSMTMVAVMNAVLSVGATPICVDCAEDDIQPSTNEYLSRATPSTRCIIVTHTYGIAPDMNAIVEMCKLKGWILIEDICEAIGTQCNGKYVGTFGDYGCASLYANKLITAGDGGFVISSCHNDSEEHMCSLRNHGFMPQFHFVHWEESGNMKINGLGAAFVTPAVRHIPVLIKNREHIAKQYRKELVGTPGLKCMPIAKYGPDAPWVFGVTLHEFSLRECVRHLLAESGIETRDYFFVLHLQPLLNHFPHVAKRNAISLPHSEYLGLSGFYLPTHNNIMDNDIQFIGMKLCEIMSSISNIPSSMKVITDKNILKRSPHLSRL